MGRRAIPRCVLLPMSVRGCSLFGRSWLLCFFFFFKQKTAYEIGLGIPAEPLFRSGVERPVKAAELFAFTLRVRAGNTDVLTDAEENVRQKLRAEGVM